MIYQRNYLTKRIDEIKKVMETMEQSGQMYFLAEKVLDLYRFELKKYTRR